MNVPIRERPLHGRNPFFDTGLTCIDFLPASDQTYNHCPISMPVQARDQKLWLGLVKASFLFLSKHESSGLLKIPRSLRFIKNGNMFYRRTAQIYQTLISKVVDILNEQLNFTQSLALLQFSSSLGFAADLIPRQRFSQNRDQWPVA